MRCKIIKIIAEGGIRIHSNEKKLYLSVKKLIKESVVRMLLTRSLQLQF